MCLLSNVVPLYDRPAFSRCHAFWRPSIERTPAPVRVVGSGPAPQLLGLANLAGPPSRRPDRPDVPVEQRRTALRPPGLLALSCVLAAQAREPHLGTVSPQDDDRHSPPH